jgi:hypothetical protein
MGSVRTARFAPVTGVGSGVASVVGARQRSRCQTCPKELVVFDLVYILGVIVLFTAIGLLGKAVEKL